ncbi:MAG: dephospho-CoA kinase [Proteobacteria bacterium]|nr:dephospho-CoA kinase [Pseudomonadota bacterium]
MSNTPTPNHTLKSNGTPSSSQVRAYRHWSDAGDRIAPVVTITGGIGSGKTACTAWLARNDIPVVDADIINACLLDTSPECLADITAAFGPSVIDSDGKAKRSAIADIIYSSKKSRLQIEAIMHPRIQRAVHTQVQQWRQMGPPYILLIIPLLPATQPSDWPSNWTVLIEAGRNARIARIKARSKMSEQRILSVIDAQCSEEEYRRIADETIDNSGTPANLHQRLDDLHQRILNKFSD